MTAWQKMIAALRRPAITAPVEPRPIYVVFAVSEEDESYLSAYSTESQAVEACAYYSANRAPVSETLEVWADTLNERRTTARLVTRITRGA